MPRQLAAAGVPPQLAGQFASGGGTALNNVAGVGNLGAKILASVPPAARPQVEPFIPAIVSGIHQAFSVATTATFQMGIFTALLAAVVVLVVLPAARMKHMEAPTPAPAITPDFEPSAD
jgi:hypothetical protein